MTELLVGTKKGLFRLEGDAPGAFEVTARAFAGQASSTRCATPDGALPRLRHLVVLRPEDLGDRRPERRVGAGIGRGAAGGRRRLARAALGHRPRGRGWGALRGRRPGPPLQEHRRRAFVGAQPRAVGAPLTRRMAAGKRRSLPPTIVPWPGDPEPVAGRDLRRGCLADGGRRRDLARRERRDRAAVHARGGAGRRDDEPLRPRRAPLAVPAGAPLHAVPRRRLPLRRRRLLVDRHRDGHRAALGLRLPDRRRPGRPGQRVRDPADRRRGPDDPRRLGQGLGDARRGRVVEPSRRRAPRAARVPHRPPRGVRHRGRGEGPAALLRRDVGRRLRVGRRRRRPGEPSPSTWRRSTACGRRSQRAA